jgi:magnesium transporter
VVRIRRLAAPEREALFQLGRGDTRLVPQEVALYFRDVHDHLVRTVDLADQLRDTLTSLTEGYLSMVSNRINEVMRVLTVIATIMMPPTLLVGIYGMNFEFMPELKWRYGYFAVWGAMAAIAGGMLFYFKRKKWW